MPAAVGRSALTMDVKDYVGVDRAALVPYWDRYDEGVFVGGRGAGSAMVRRARAALEEKNIWRALDGLPSDDPSMVIETYAPVDATHLRYIRSRNRALVDRGELVVCTCAVASKKMQRFVLLETKMKDTGRDADGELDVVITNAVDVTERILPLIQHHDDAEFEARLAQWRKQKEKAWSGPEDSTEYAKLHRKFSSFSDFQKWLNRETAKALKRNQRLRRASGGLIPVTRSEGAGATSTNAASLE